jgi:hypothetical protein
MSLSSLTISLQMMINDTKTFLLSYCYNIFATLGSYLRRQRSVRSILKLEGWVTIYCSGSKLQHWWPMSTNRTCKFILQVTSTKIITFNFHNVHSSWFSLSVHFLWYLWAPSIFTTNCENKTSQHVCSCTMPILTQNKLIQWILTA